MKPISQWEPISIHMQDRIADLEARLAEAAKLKKAVEYCRINKLRVRVRNDNISKGKIVWDIWDEINRQILSDGGTGDTFIAAVADYREKNEKPEEISNEQWNKKYVKAMMLLKETNEIYKRDQRDEPDDVAEDSWRIDVMTRVNTFLGGLR